MRMKAAVLHEAGAPLLVEEVQLEAPREGEVLVKLVGTGVCHTDVAAAKRQAVLPIILGHEGAGIVQEVGPGVKSPKPGDHVVLTGAAACGKCRSCAVGRPSLCEVFRPLYFNGMLPGGRRLRTLKGEEINHFFLQSSFAQYATVPQEVAIKVRDDAPLDVVGILGCGALTGLGSVINNAKPETGAVIAVFGCGGVGLSAVMGARLCGASKIIAIDVLDSKLETARALGATHTVNSKLASPNAQIRQLADRGADYSIVAVGAPGVFDEAFRATRFGGKCVVISTPGSVTVDGGQLVQEKMVVGCSMGSGRPALDIPMYVDFFMNGRLPLDRLVTGRYPLEKINEAFRAQEEGGAIKPMIVF